MYYGDLRCIRCNRPAETTWAYDECPHCRAEGVSANYSAQIDVPANGVLETEGQPGLWKYRSFYAVDPQVEAVSLIEGDTPLVHAMNLGERLGLEKLYLKDESRNPTWSHKDRLTSVGVTKAKEIGAACVVLSSTGNQGASAAAYAAKAGIDCVIFTANSSPRTMKTMMQSFGAKIFEIPTGAERTVLVEACVRELGWFPLTGFGSNPKGSNPYALDGYKSIAFELLRDLGDVPDKVILPTAGGDALVGIWKGFLDLFAMKMIDKLPAMIATEPFGPLTRTISEGSQIPLSVDRGDTVAFSVATGTGTFQALKALYDSNGLATVVQDPAMMTMQQRLAASEGIFVEPASAMGVAAAEDLLKQGRIRRDEKVVVVLTSTGLKEPYSAIEYLPELATIEPSLRSLRENLKSEYNFAI